MMRESTRQVALSRTSALGTTKGLPLVSSTMHSSTAKQDTLIHVGTFCAQVRRPPNCACAGPSRRAGVPESLCMHASFCMLIAMPGDQLVVAALGPPTIPRWPAPFYPCTLSIHRCEPSDKDAPSPVELCHSFPTCLPTVHQTLQLALVHWMRHEISCQPTLSGPNHENQYPLGFFNPTAKYVSPWSVARTSLTDR